MEYHLFLQGSQNTDLSTYNFSNYYSWLINTQPLLEDILLQKQKVSGTAVDFNFRIN